MKSIYDNDRVNAMAFNGSVGVQKAQSIYDNDKVNALIAKSIYDNDKVNATAENSVPKEKTASENWWEKGAGNAPNRQNVSMQGSTQKAVTNDELSNFGKAFGSYTALGAKNAVKNVGNAIMLKNAEEAEKTNKLFASSNNDWLYNFFPEDKKVRKMQKDFELRKILRDKNIEASQKIQNSTKESIIKQNEEKSQLDKKYENVRGRDLADMAGSGVGQMLPNIATNIVAPGAGMLTFGASVKGSSTAEALNEGYDFDKANSYGSAEAIKEFAIEKLFGGIPTMGNGIISPEKLVSKYISSDMGKYVVKRLCEITGEGLEEVVADYISPFIKRFYFSKEKGIEKMKDSSVSTLPTFEELKHSFGGGAIVSALLGVANIKNNFNEIQGNNNAKVEENVKQSTAFAENSSNSNNPLPTLEERKNNYGTQTVETPLALPERAVLIADDEGRIADRDYASKHNFSEIDTVETAKKKHRENLDRVKAIFESDKYKKSRQPVNIKWENAQRDAGVNLDDSFKNLKDALWFDSLAKKEKDSLTEVLPKRIPSFYGTRGIFKNTDTNMHTSPESAANTVDFKVPKNQATVRPIPKVNPYAGLYENLAAKKVSKRVRRVLNSLGEKVGVQIIVEKNLQGTNGYYNGRDNTLHISLSAENPMGVVVSHEITHRLKEISPDDYVKLKNITEEMLKVEGSYNELSSKLSEVYKASDVDEELICHATSLFAQDISYFEKLCNIDRSLAQKLLDLLDDFIHANWNTVGTNEEFNLPLGEYTPGEILQIRNAWEKMLEKADKEKSASNETIKSSVKFDADQKPYVVVDNDILRDVPKNQWVKKVKEIFKQKYPNGIDMGYFKIKTNADSRSEFTNSKYTQFIREHKTNLYSHKMQMIDKLDEIVKNAYGTINQGLKHPRKDNYKSFNHGEINVRIGSFDYNVEIVTAINTNNDEVFYDIVDIRPTTISNRLYNKKKTTPTGVNPISGAVPNDIKSQSDTSVNNQYIQNFDNYAENKNSLKLGEEFKEYFRDHEPLEGERRDFKGFEVENLGSSDIYDNLKNLYEESRKEAGEIDFKTPVDSDIAEVLVDNPKRGNEKFSDSVDFLKRKLTDTGTTIEKIGELCEDKTLYRLFNNAKQSRQAAENMLGNAQCDINGNVVGESLRNIFAPLRDKGDDYFKYFEEYLLHYHNRDRMTLVKRGNEAIRNEIYKLVSENPSLASMETKDLLELSKKTTNEGKAAKKLLYLNEKANNLKDKPVFGKEITAQRSDAFIRRAEAENPEFLEYAKKIWDYNKNLMQYRIDTGLVSKEQSSLMNELYPHYVPVFLNASSSNPALFYSDRTSKVNKTIKRAKGNYGYNILPLDNSIAQQTLQVIKEGRRNLVGNKLLALALQNKDKIGRYVQSAYDSIFDYDLDDPTDLNNAFLVFCGGEPVEMRVNPGVMEAVKDLSPRREEYSDVLKAVKAGNNIFKALVTGYDPRFIVKNIIRDTQDAGLYSRNSKEFAKYLPSALLNIGKLESGKGTDNPRMAKLWQIYKSMGGTGTSYFDYEHGLDHNLKMSKNPLDYVEKLNSMVEQAPRFAEFCLIIEKEHGGKLNYDNILDAMLGAADVTVNFGRSGSLVRELNSTFVPFLNPSVQGFSKLVREVSGKGATAKNAGDIKTARINAVKTLCIRSALLGVVPSVLNHLLYSDDDEYKDITDREKDQNYLVKISKGNWLKLPKGRVLSVVGAASRRNIELKEGEENAFEGFTEHAASQILPTDPFRNHIVAQILNTDLGNENSSGQTWYGTDIVPRSMMNRPQKEQWDERTDKLSILLGKVTGKSPKKINYLLESYTGFAGDMLLPLLTPSAEKGMFRQSFFIDPVTQNKVSTEFYGACDKAIKDKNSFHPSAGSDVVSRFLNKAKKESAVHSDAIHEIQGSNLKDKEKLEKVRDVRRIGNAFQKEVLNILPQYKKTAEKYANKAKLLSFENKKAESNYIYREANREVFGAEYAIKTYNEEVYEKALKAKYENGVSFDDFYLAYFAQKGIEGDKDKKGNTIPLSADKKKVESINKALPKANQKDMDKIYDAVGISKNARGHIGFKALPKVKGKLKKLPKLR